MKYKHYSPKAEVILVSADDKKYIDFVNGKKSESTAALCYDGDSDFLEVKTYLLGAKDNYKAQAHKLFKMLREIDKNPEIKTVYARCPEPNGVGMAVYNRLVRAAGFEVINLEKV